MATAKLEKATELEWLRWFALNADFGPAHGDVMDRLKGAFIRAKRKNLPDGWNFDSSGKEIPDR